MSAQDQPVIDATFLMDRMPGKGGWTFVVLPAIPRELIRSRNMVRVSGTIDAVPLLHYTLMPVKGGGFFLPVKAALRKQLGKEAGDTVRIVLFVDNTPYGIPDELKACLEFEPPSYERFLALTESVQKRNVDWIYEAKTEETKVRRIARVIERMLES